MILSVAVIFTCFALSAAHGKKLHEHMTKEEIESVFNVKHDSVHELDYDILRVHHLSKRDVYMKSFSHEFYFYLNDNKVLLGSETPIYIAKYNISNNRPYYTKTYYRDYFPGNLKLYHDYENQAAFAVHTDRNNNRHFDGVIGKHVHIRSIPDRLHALLETSPDIANLPRDAFMDNSTYHVIINKTMHRHTRDNNARKAKMIPHTGDTVYPEILITVDYETFGLHGWDIKKSAKYIAGFWNAVDLRYRELVDPKVRLNIAGLVISAEDGFSARYITETKPVTDSYDRSKFIDATSRFYAVDQKDMFPTDSYDVLVAMTSDKRGIFNDKQKKKVTGELTYKGGACHRVNRTAVVPFDGDFTHVKAATHALGHLFGAGEDLVGTGGDCDAEMGYLMSWREAEQRSLRWSRCSKDAMKAFFNSEDSECLKNMPYVGKRYPTILPGTLLSREEQCLRLFGTSAETQEHYQSDCETLWCRPKNVWVLLGFSITSELRLNEWSVAEGTYCGVNKICLDGHCVEDSPAYHSTNSLWYH